MTSKSGSAKSRHFQLYTDASARDATELLKLLEDAYDNVSAASVFFYRTGAPAKPDIKWDVFAVRHRQALTSFGVKDAMGFVGQQAQDGIPKKALYIAADNGVMTRAVIQHELSHAFTAALLPSAPRWLNEGLAELVSEAGECNGRLCVARCHKVLPT